MQHRYAHATRVALATVLSLLALGAQPTTTSQASRDALSAATGVDGEISHVAQRWQLDRAAMQIFRPGYAFWQHIFTIPDGSIAFGSAVDGRLLAVFPTRGDWQREAVWSEASLATTLAGHDLPRDLDDRRDLVAELLEQAVGPVVHNPTRGHFLAPSASRYGDFLRDWGAIYERFGVPAEIGLAQAVIESGLDGTRRSSAGAVGFCQWLRRNWRVLDRLSPHTLESGNQTTQAAYCAAYLTVLATKHGSLIPALSEHHSGGTNVARTLINGERLGGIDTRERYFLGSQLARDLRLIASGTYSDLYRTYGPRSYRYAEMIFGNTHTVANIISSKPQVSIFAMRTSRALSIAEVMRRSRLSRDQIRRFNPALARRVPAGATLYLPKYFKELGRDVTFWRRPATPAFTELLDEFVRLDSEAERWDDPDFAQTLREFEQRFRATKTEEGQVMATVIAYCIQEMYASGRERILHEFRTSEQIRELFERAVRERDLWVANAGT
jgi:hypothetical protein